MGFTTWLENQNWIQKGETVYVVSDMLELAYTEKQKGQRLDLNKLIDCLQNLVGPEGTLLFPTFNWDFCKGIAFDYYHTPVRTGSLPKAALKRKDFIRTTHPIYSFAIWGARTEEILRITGPDSFGPGTIFDKMTEWNTKVFVIGLGPLAGVTYVHHVEQMTGVPYRYHKNFTAEYTDASGETDVRTYTMYVRDLDMNPLEINGFAPLGEQMQRDGTVLTRYYGEVPCHSMMVVDVFDAAQKDILENDSRKMYQYRGQS